MMRVRRRRRRAPSAAPGCKIMVFDSTSFHLHIAFCSVAWSGQTEMVCAISKSLQACHSCHSSEYNTLHFPQTRNEAIGEEDLDSETLAPGRLFWRWQSFRKLTSISISCSTASLNVGLCILGLLMHVVHQQFSPISLDSTLFAKQSSMKCV